MDGVRLGDLRSVREVLGTSQRELSELLDVSLRAVQSYEQGWRPTPPHVQKLAGMQLFLRWRKKQRRVRACWDVCKCSLKTRQDCSAWRLGAGDLCWMVTGTSCDGRPARSWEQKVDRCTACPVTAGWLGAPTSARRPGRRG